MSLAHVSTVVQKFVSDKFPDLLVIKGSWGVGKTCFWSELVEKASSNGKIAYPYYSYVSLFGVNSLEELKTTIFASRVEASKIKKAGFSDFIKSVKQLVDEAKDTPFIQQYIGNMASAGAFFALKDTLICFDDIERKGDQLSLKELFGLASLLKEQKNCKVVFILNEDSLTPDEIDELKKHAEKVVDFEVRFDPLPEEAFNIVFENDYLYYKYLKENCLKLEIKNIRIIKRIRRLMDELAAFLKDVSPQITERVIHSLVLYILCHFDKENNLPTLKFLLDYNQLFVRFGFKDDNEDSQQKSWYEFLKTYGYYSTDDIDKYLISWLQQGYLDEKSLQTELTDKNEKTKSLILWEKAWELYRSFEDNEDEFVNELSSNFRRGMIYRTVSDLSSLVDVFRDLGYETLVNTIIDEYFAAHSSDIDIRRLERSSFLNNVKEQYLLQKIQEVWNKRQKDMSLADVVRSIRNGWNPEDIQFLALSEVEDYYNFFKSLTLDDIHFDIRTCLRFGELQNADDNQKMIAEKAKSALIKIAKESRFNRVRIENFFKIRIED